MTSVNPGSGQDQPVPQEFHWSNLLLFFLEDVLLLLTFLLLLLYLLLDLHALSLSLSRFFL